MNVVFILGAGASRDAGGPLMQDFLDVAEEVARVRLKGEKYKELFENVFQSRAELRTVHSKSYLDLDNIESIFGAIEMGAIIEKFGMKTVNQISELRESIITLIYKTLEYSIEFPIESERVSPPQPYEDFIEILKSHRGTIGSVSETKYSFITFNYDVCLEYALFKSGIGFDYNLPKILGNGPPLLKLHGSLNWGRCDECKNIVPFQVKDIPFPEFLPEKSYFLDMGSNLSLVKCADDNKNIQGPPILVPPAWEKTHYQKSLSPVWARAAKCLGDANKIIIIGYSMPETDSFFKYLFALGTDSKTHLKNVLVINPDNSGDTKNRFEKLFGPGLRNRIKFKEKTFKEAVDNNLIEDELKRKFETDG